MNSAKLNPTARPASQPTADYPTQSRPEVKTPHIAECGSGRLAFRWACGCSFDGVLYPENAARQQDHVTHNVCPVCAAEERITGMWHPARFGVTA